MGSIEDRLEEGVPVSPSPDPNDGALGGLSLTTLSERISDRG